MPALFIASSASAIRGVRTSERPELQQQFDGAPAMGHQKLLPASRVLILIRPELECDHGAPM